MDSIRFDAIVRALARPVSRRHGIAAALLAVAGTVPAPGAGAKKRKKCKPPCTGDLACIKGTCGCKAGTACGDACVDLQLDRDNCGACGVVCSSPSGFSCCRAGVCKESPYDFDDEFGSTGPGADQFRNPGGMAPYGFGGALVADVLNHRVDLWDVSGDEPQRRASFGAFGAGMDQLHNPADVAVGPTGLVFVADTLNHRIAVWVNMGLNGAINFVNLAAFGSFGSLPDELKSPLGVAVDEDGDVYVADSGNNRVSVWRESGGAWAVQNNFGGPGSGGGQLAFPAGIAVQDGVVLVSDFGNDRVSGWTTVAGSWTNTVVLGSSGSGYDRLDGPTGIEVTGGVVTVADTGNHRVSVWEGFSATYVPVGTVGGQGSGPGQFENPVGVTYAGGALLVADRTRDVVSRWRWACNA